MTVARSENELLAGWRATLRTDALVGGAILSMIVLLAALLSWQFRFRIKTERALRERETRYRLLADNIADIVILLDRTGVLLYVSPSVEPVLGLRGQDLVGRSCFDLVYIEDRERVLSTTAQLGAPDSTNTVAFRIARADGSIAWIEINFKLAAEHSDQEQVKFVGVLRDVTQRKMMEDELTSLNGRLAQLATTDGLTGLCQPPHLRRLPAPRISRRIRPAFGAAVRYRPFQGLQRQLWPSGRRRVPESRRQGHRRRDRPTPPACRRATAARSSSLSCLT